MIRRAILTGAAVATVATAGGCVQRKLTVTSEPSGALVFLNDREVGRTPINTDFVWYGEYDVQVRKDGFTTLDRPTRLRAPWWQIPPVDFFAELAPWHPTDRQAMHFVLSPRPNEDRPTDDLVTRGAAFKQQLESPDRRAATQPTTRKSIFR